jgi:hypothetical protein
MAELEKEVRRALNRLRRAVEKAEREVDGVVGAISHVEGSDFPTHSYEEARQWMANVRGFCDEESARLQMKVLSAGGLEPGRVRRSSGL